MDWHKYLRIALMNSSRIGISKFLEAHAINSFKSVLLMEPMGLMSAELQSYFVRSKAKVST